MHAPSTTREGGVGFYTKHYITYTFCYDKSRICQCFSIFLLQRHLPQMFVLLMEPYAMAPGTNFHFRGPRLFWIGAPIEGLQRLMSYKSALHVLTTFTEQVVPIHKHITLFWLPSVSGTRASPISPIAWPTTLSQETQNSELKPPNKNSIP